MEAQEAKAIFDKQRKFGGEVSPKKMDVLGWYAYAIAGDTQVTLDGNFTADELEAIAMWLRDPAAVTGAN